MSITHVPEEEENASGVVIGGIEKTWTYSPVLEDLLTKILNELKKIRIHNEMITGNEITEEDINED